MADDEQVKRQLQERGNRLASLKQHPAWDDLKTILKTTRENDLKVLAAQFMGGAPVDQRRVDERRGFWQGAAFVLAHPEGAESKLRAALAELEAQRQQEGTDE